jgi:hypothetical protein
VDVKKKKKSIVQWNSLGEGRWREGDGGVGGIARAEEIEIGQRCCEKADSDLHRCANLVLQQ